MSTDELDVTALPADDTAESPPLKLEVKVESPTACERHITVTIAREDIDRYYDEAFSEMMETASVPGFRAGRAPRKLVEARYRKEVGEQIKGTLLLDSMSQVNEQQKLAAISEPDIDLDAIDIPDEGPLTFEFDLEVRPDFELPDWKGLTVERPAADFSDEDIEQRLKEILVEHGRRVPTDQPADVGDYVTVNMTFKHEQRVIQQAAEKTLCIRPTLSFRDGKIQQFDELMNGAKAGDVRSTALTLSPDAPNEALAGQQVEVTFELLDVKRFELPEMSHEFLDEIGGFETEEELRDAVRGNLVRQVEYDQQRRIREQITQQLTEAAGWELPPAMLKRQSGRELERSVLELRRSGFSEADIQAHSNELRQNSKAATARALREHFILERIAEEEDLDVTEEDYQQEIALIAGQTSDSPRRVRAQIEKRGLMDSLRNQIIERKVIEQVTEHATFKDVPFEHEGSDVEAVDLAAAGGDSAEIPEAKHGEVETLAAPKDHT